MEKLQMIFCLLFILTVLLKFVFNNDRLLISLLSLEFIMLSLSLSLVFFLCSSGGEGVVFLYFMVMVVCEAVLGLCLLIAGSFSFSSDYMKNFNSIMN